ncbi:MAG: hypothetical protein ACRDJH_08255 [Thermomicrobiales bacterium]
MNTTFTRRAALTGLFAGFGGLALGPRIARGTRQDASPAATTGEIVHPTGADELVLRIHVGGGFVPLQFHITEAPQFSVYGDGRVLFLGPQIEIYPPPALPNLRVLRLTEDGLQQLLAEANDAGLIGRGRQYDNDYVADAPTTAITVNANGQTTVVAAYALGFVESTSATEEEQVELEKIAKFVERMINLAEWLPASAIAEPEDAYQIDRLQVVVAAETFAVTAGDDLTPVPPVDWPLAAPLSSFGDPYEGYGMEGARCAELTGDDLAALLPLLENAGSFAPWQSEGQTYAVLFRPLLPDESPCGPPGLHVDPSLFEATPET